ncbi:MAG TPA: hypothetical protein VIM64_13600, partial [Puia sp.]
MRKNMTRLLIVVLLFIAGTASAQTEKKNINKSLGDSTRIQDLEGVVIVGSRAGVRSKLSTTVPVDVVTTKEIKPFAQTDVAQMLTYTVPSFQ